jgi:hypothetical protein
VYEWHDGRLHALATVALAPGQRYVGQWRIPLLVAGQRTALTGGLWHADDPSIVWFWPIAVVLLCLWAVARLGIRALDRRMATGLSIAALASVAILAIGHQLDGQPFVGVGQEIVLGLILAFVAVVLGWVLIRGAGAFSLILVAVAALWSGLEFLPTLLHGYVISVVPAFLVRVATVTCLSAGLAAVILLFGFRLVDVPEEAGQEEALSDSTGDPKREEIEAWESFPRAG